MAARWLLAAGLAVALAGCATGYHPSGFAGGYSDWQLDANTYRVAFRGNGYTARETVEMYLLYRCAELTAANGYDYFIVLDGRSDGGTYTYWLPGHYSSNTTATATFVGNTAYGSANTTGTYTPPQPIQFQKYEAAAVIKAFKGQRPDDIPNAFVATEVLAYMGPQIQR